MKNLFASHRHKETIEGYETEIDRLRMGVIDLVLGLTNALREKNDLQKKYDRLRIESADVLGDIRDARKVLNEHVADLQGVQGCLRDAEAALSKLVEKEDAESA